MLRVNKMLFAAALAATLLVWGVGFVRAQTASPVQSGASAAVEAGQRVFVCGHSFHRFITKPLAMLAKEAGYNHVALGEDFIGGSYPIQHWNRPDEKNPAKQVLKTGNVDVLTLAPNRDAPDPGVEKFSLLTAETNPNARVMLQLSWLPWDGQPADKFTNADHNRADAKALEAMAKWSEEYSDRLRAQSRELNGKAGRDFVYLVPVGAALLRARAMVLEGKLPGVKQQSELFADPMGHAAGPLVNLASYCWFAAVYRKSPVGLTSLDKPGDETSRKLNRVLQQIAWEVVTREPASGAPTRGTDK